MLTLRDLYNLDLALAVFHILEPLIKHLMEAHKPQTNWKRNPRLICVQVLRGGCIFKFISCIFTKFQLKCWGKQTKHKQTKKKKGGGRGVQSEANEKDSKGLIIKCSTSGRLSRLAFCMIKKEDCQSSE